MSAPLITIGEELCGKTFFFMAHGMPHSGICNLKAGHDGDCGWADENVDGEVGYPGIGR